jgi:hypothetical protein
LLPLVMLAIGPHWCAAQTLFEPPTAPPAGAPTSNVRGIADPAAQPDFTRPGTPASPWGQPADFAPDAEMPPPVDPGGITPTPMPVEKPIEGSEIIARIDGEVILASDVLWQVKQLVKMMTAQYAEAGRPVPPEAIEDAERGLTRQLMLGMLDTKMIYADFRRKVPAEALPNISKSLEEPFEESEIPRLIGMLKLNNRDELEKLLRDSGTSLKDVRRQFVEKQIASKWLQEQAPKPEPITYEQLRAYYDDHLKEYEFEAIAAAATATKPGDSSAIWGTPLRQWGRRTRSSAAPRSPRSHARDRTACRPKSAGSMIGRRWGRCGAKRSTNYSPRCRWGR